MIVITGSRGPLGHAMQQVLDKPNSCFMNSQMADLTNTEQTYEYLRLLSESYEISSVIHLAARSGGGHRSLNESASMFRDNMLMTLNLLDACQRLDIKNIILVSSIAAYPSSVLNPSEANIHNGPIDSNDFSYGYAKRMMEPIMRAYNSQYGLSIKTVVVNGILGPHMNFDDNTSILPAALIKRFHSERNLDSPLIVWGDGTPIRQYTFSHDLARILLWCESFQSPNTLLNIGSSESISVRNLAELVCQHLGISKQRLAFDVTKGNGRKAQMMSNQDFVGQSQFKYTTISDSLKETINWYVAENR